LLNAADIDVGQTLADFKAFSQGLPADVRACAPTKHVEQTCAQCRGLAISNSEKIREAHNSFARNDPFIMDEVKATKEDDVYHVRLPNK
jgi:ubiquitin carboxyl-terminal hydrolase L5